MPTAYTNVNPQGKQTYDQSDITYNDANVFYDSIDFNAYTYVETPSVAWNISRASLYNTYSVVAQASRPEWIFFKPDGTKMYIGNGQTGTTVFEYNLTAWDLSTLSYVQTYTITGIGYNSGGFFSGDGLKMYILNNTGSDTLREYDLSTAWDISTTTYLREFNLSSYDQNNEGLFFSPDGTKAYITGDQSNEINQFSLDTPWNVGTMRFVQSFDVSTQVTNVDGLFMKSDGTKLYVLQWAGASTLFEYDLIIPWNLGTAYFNRSLSLSATDISTFSVFFKSDGLTMFVTENSTQSVMEFRFEGQYTNVPKPTGGQLVTILEGMATGLIIPPTYSYTFQVGDSSYTNVNKPTT